MAEGFITRKGGGVNVNDATATENDVLQGKTFYSGDKDIKTGNIPTKDNETFTPGTSNQIIANGQYLSGDQTILGDPNLIPENIKNGVTIFGVTGNFEGSFDPNSISDLFYWFDSSQTNFTNGQSISSWEDVTNTITISQSSSSLRPTFVTNVKNGLPVVRFSNNFLETDYSTNSQPNTIFLVADIKSVGNDNDYVIAGNDGSLGRQDIIIMNGNSFPRRFTAFAGVVDETDEHQATTGWHYFNVVFNGSNSIFKLDDSEKNHDIGTLPSYGFTIGSYASNENIYYTEMDFAEYLYYDRVLTTQERESVENYLKNKWAL